MFFMEFLLDRVDVVLKNGLRIRTNLCDQHMTNIITGVSVSLAPNPTEANTAITVVTAEPQDLSITLLDNSGRVIRSSNVSMQANRILIPLNVSDLAAGMYNVQVTWSNGSKVLKLIKE